MIKCLADLGKESLQDFAMSLSHDTTKGLEKKARLGQKALSFLIQNFGNQRRSRWTRRWVRLLKHVSVEPYSWLIDGNFRP